MKWLSLVFIFLSSVVFAGEELEVELSSGNVISIDAYASDGDTLFLYLPSERGFGKGHVPTMQQLTFEGYDVWVADLHTSYMTPKHRSSIGRFNIDDILELIDYAKQKSFILHSPHLIDGKPDLGKTANYVDIAKLSNLPVYLLLPQFGTKYFRGEEIAAQLKKGGSEVFVHRFKDVHGGFHMRDVKDLTKIDIKAKDGLSDTYHRAVRLMSTINVFKPFIANKDIQKSPKVVSSGPVLKPYKGKQRIRLRLKTFDDQILDINSYKNQVVLLNFWASWCKPCVKEIPSLIRLQQQFKDQSFQIITINIGESKKDMADFLKKVKLELPIMLDTDGQAVKDWGVYAYPSNFVLDKDGVIRYAYRGALEWDAPEIVNTIKTLL